MLMAAGFSEDALLVRDARRAGWAHGLKSTAAVICDCVTAPQLPKECNAIVFPLLAEASIEELKRVEEFVRDPLKP
jgi:GntR family transcriptional regulator